MYLLHFKAYLNLHIQHKWRGKPKNITLALIFGWMNKPKHLFSIWTTVPAWSEEFYVRHEKHALRSGAWPLRNSCHDRGGRKVMPSVWQIFLVRLVWLLQFQLSSYIQTGLGQAWKALWISKGWYFKGLVTVRRLCKKPNTATSSAPGRGRQSDANSRWWGWRGARNHKQHADREQPPEELK